MRSRADLESIWQSCTHHRELLARSERAGCFHCLGIFAPAEIADWIDEPDTAAGASGGVSAEGVTALCPRCGIDAVLPSAGTALDAALLREMNAHFFGTPFTVATPEGGGCG